MGKRLSPEQREARLKAVLDRKAEREAKRREREEERQRRIREREIRRKARRGPVEANSSDPVKSLSPFVGTIKEGDEVGFRWLGMVFGGKVVSISREQAYRQVEGMEDKESEEEVGVGTIVYYECQTSNGNIYPALRKDIVCKKISGIWKERE